MYDFTFWKKDLEKSLFKTDYQGLCSFFKFIEHAKAKELKQLAKITIFPKKDGRFYIDLEPRSIKKFFTLSGESVDNFIAFYESVDKCNIARMSMNTEK